MNNPNFYAQAEANQGKFRHHPPTAAVIRPLQTIEGTEQSIRVDANQTLRGPHRRSQQLNDYVSWLQQQSVEQINQADQIAGYEQEQAQLQAQQQRQPQQGTSSDAKTGGWTFSSASKMVFGTKSDLDIPTSDAPGNRRDATQMEKPPRKQPPKSKPIIEFVTSRRIEKTIDRLDSPHATSGSGRVPAPKMAASDYPVADIQVDADLGRILQKLETNEQNPVVSPVENDLSNDWLSDSSTNHSSARTSVPDEPVPTVADHPTSNVRDFFSPPPGRKKIFPAEFMHVDSVIDDQMNHTLSNQTATENLSKQEIIETVSKAIAAVLTDQNESVIERKVRERFEELQRELKIQTETSLAQPSGLESPRPIETKQVMNPKNEPSAVPTPAVDTTKFAKTLDAPPVQTNLPKSGSSKVPVEIAAWDVNDFRWPTISTQMITVGSKAIEALYRSLEPSSRSTGQVNRKRIAITSPIGNAGTTSIAMSLARWGASEGRRVLLVDADLKNPELSNQVGLGNKISWMQSVINPNPEPNNVADLIIRSQQSQLCIMPLAIEATSANRPKYVLDYLARMIDQVSDHFDLIIIDLGTAEQITAELSHAELLVDSALLVHQQRTPEIDQIQSRLKTFGVQQIVLAQNAAQSNVSLNVA